LSTWLVTIVGRVALDVLSRRRVAADGKLRLREHVYAEPEHAEELRRHQAAGQFDVREHIAFCFGCVARSLPPEEQLALVLRDVMELSNDEAARVSEVTTSVLRHRLASARSTMQQRYEGLCRLVSKEGVCWQCDGLRDSFAPARRGPSLPIIDGDGDRERAYDARMTVVRTADVEHGASQELHDFLWRALRALTL